MALLTVLEGLQEMGFSARRELAWWIRIWLHRIIRTAGMIPLALPESLNNDQIANLVGAVADGNTATFGVLEQRVLDAIATTIHPGWRQRGVGDPVNATNISSAKLGDCDFLDVASTSVHAYESHGGILSPIYVERHIATLRKSILRRIYELTAVADVNAWGATINFVAHGIIGQIPQRETVQGLTIQIRATTFADFLRQHAAEITPQIAVAVERHVLAPLREQRTPNEVRQAFLEIIR